jgi:hypothetical protein
MNILNQALLLKDGATFSKVKKLIILARNYQKENDELFLYAKPRDVVKILDEEIFFKFLSEVSGIKVRSFEDIQRYLQTNSKKENIIFTTSSKTKNIHPFNKTVLLRKKGELAKIYQEDDLKDIKIDKVVAIENSESFLQIDKIWNKFKSEYFVYLGGNANLLTREFLTTLDVCFFIDFDIVSLNFYENIKTKSKQLYIPNNLEKLFIKYGNEKLYKKQRRFLKNGYSNEATKVIELIKRYKKVLEQEIL